MKPYDAKSKILNRKNCDNCQSKRGIKICSSGPKKRHKFMLMEKAYRAEPRQESHPVSCNDKQKYCRNQRKKLFDVTSGDGGKKIMKTADEYFCHRLNRPGYNCNATGREP